MACAQWNKPNYATIILPIGIKLNVKLGTHIMQMPYTVLNDKLSIYVAIRNFIYFITIANHNIFIITASPINLMNCSEIRKQL